VQVEASIGIALFPEDGDEVGTLIHQADMAMYQAKSAGRATYRYASGTCC
jgi:diguanylate cyclase (GGDEF)-like protein